MKLQGCVGRPPSFPAWPRVKPVTAGLVLTVFGTCTGEHPGDGAKLTHRKSPRGSRPPGQSGEVDSTIYTEVGCHTSSPPGEAPVTRASTPGGQVGVAVLFTQHISSQSTWAGGHLGDLLEGNSRSVRRDISHGWRSPALPSPGFQVVQDESTCRGPDGAHGKEALPSWALAPILAGGTLTAKDHQPPSAHHQERTHQGWTLPRRAKRQMSHIQGATHLTPLGPCQL